MAPEPRVPIKSGAKPSLVRKLIKQTGFFRKKIVKHERVAVANNQQRAVGIGSYCRAGFFVADRSNGDLFRPELLSIGLRQDRQDRL